MIDNRIDGGSVKIADEVIQSIAGLALSEIKGVTNISGSIAGSIVDAIAGKKNASKGIKVTVNGNDAVVDIKIDVLYGTKIQDVAWEIQGRIKRDVETMTGLNVTAVNVSVESVSVEKPEKPENETEEVLDAEVEIVDANEE